MTMPFGKYCGQDIGDIPTSYLRWLCGNANLYGVLADEIEAELDRRLFNQRQQSSESHATFLTPLAEPGWIHFDPADISLFREIVDHGYKVSARVYHPDAGGSVVMMQRLNALVQSLRTQLSKMGSPV
jgi:hypothetical protein